MPMVPYLYGRTRGDDQLLPLAPEHHTAPSDTTIDLFPEYISRPAAHIVNSKSPGGICGCDLLSFRAHGNANDGIIPPTIPRVSRVNAGDLRTDRLPGKGAS